MPDFIRIAASGASGVYLGSVARIDGVDWGSEVIQRQYNESVNAYGGAFAYANAGLRRIVLPFIFQGTNVDNANQFISQVQGQIPLGGGGVLDVQLEGASWLTRFDVLGGQIIPERDIRYHRQNIMTGRIELETIPFGYTPTTMVAVSVPSFNLGYPSGFVMQATVIGDVAGPMQLIIGGTTATSGATGFAAAPYGYYIGLREGATVAGGGIATTLILGPAGSVLGNIAAGGSVTGFMNGATLWWGQSTDSLNLRQSASGPTQLPLFSFLAPTGAQMGVPERRRAMVNMAQHPSSATLTLYLFETYTNRILSKRVSLPPGPPIGGYRARMVDFGEISLDGFINANTITIAADLSDRTLFASTPSQTGSVPVYVMDPFMILSPADDALVIVPTALGVQANVAGYLLRQSGYNAGATIATSFPTSNTVVYAINATQAVDLATFAAGAPSPYRFSIDPIVRGARPFWPPNPSGVAHSLHVVPISVPDYVITGAQGTTASIPSAAMIAASGVYSISVTYQPRWLFVR